MSTPSPSCRFDLEEQHRHIHTVLDALHDSADNPDAIDVLVTYLERLLRIHFHAEEKLAIEHEFPNWTAHASEHSDLLSDICQHAALLRSRGITDSERLRLFIERLNLHIVFADRALDEFLDSTNACPTGSPERTTLSDPSPSD